MKTLFLMRHGQAETKEKQPDIERNLDSKGIKEAKIVAEALLKAELRPELMLSSHANRAYQTAQIIAETLAYPVKNIKIEQGIYYTSEEDLLEVIQVQAFEVNSIMVAGHNPSISRLARRLSKQVEDILPTAGLLIVESHSPNWEDFLKYDIEHKAFIVPDDIQH